MDLLIVSRDAALVEDLRSSFRKDGHTVRSAPTPSEGLAAAKEHPPEVVVLQCEGLEEAKQFRGGLEARCPDRAIPVLPLSRTEPRETVVRGVAEILEAEISCRGKGSGKRGEGSGRGAAGPPRPAGTILLVDDRDSARRRLVRLFQTSGWTVYETDTARGGILALLDHEIDCLLVSAMLEGRPSREFVRGAAEVRKVHPRSFAILVVADVDDSEFASSFLDAGADDIVGRSAGVRLMQCRLRVACKFRDLLRENRSLKEHVAERAAPAAEPAAG